MAELVQVGETTGRGAAAWGSATAPGRRVYWLQAVTLAWLLMEVGVSMFAAVAARSAAILAFGSDSLVEVLSATVVLLQWAPGVAVSERRATRVASVLLFVLAAVVAGIAAVSLVWRVRAETSYAGIGITVAALLMMPVLSAMKRREARRSGNRALAADAVQSATCAYLAMITLVGMGVNAVFHVAWFDSLAALLAVPVLVAEGRSAWRGQGCGCC